VEINDSSKSSAHDNFVDQITKMMLEFYIAGKARKAGLAGKATEEKR
jgi:hypothetical protein